jgi:hypothetical protein
MAIVIAVIDVIVADYAVHDFFRGGDPCLVFNHDLSRGRASSRMDLVE